ncbi:hypothetical protein FQN57_005108 [Myotisia sp. PD_48]|nr:hypothetical protein FQN57_005108 [Myotisia sp. PD_48]
MVLRTIHGIRTKWGECSASKVQIKAAKYNITTALLKAITEHFTYEFATILQGDIGGAHNTTTEDGKAQEDPTHITAAINKPKALQRSREYILSNTNLTPFNSHGISTSRLWASMDRISKMFMLTSLQEASPVNLDGATDSDPSPKTVTLRGKRTLPEPNSTTLSPLLLPMLLCMKVQWAAQYCVIVPNIGPPARKPPPFNTYVGITTNAAIEKAIKGKSGAAMKDWRVIVRRWERNTLKWFALGNVDIFPPKTTEEQIKDVIDYLDRQSRDESDGTLVLAAEYVGRPSALTVRQPRLTQAQFQEEADKELDIAKAA